MREKGCSIRVTSFLKGLKTAWKGSKNMRKKTLAALMMALGILCVLVLPAGAEAAGYSDTRGHYAQEAIEAWSGYGVLKGYPNGIFRPDGAITRGELAVVLDRVMGYRNKAENTYSDLPEGKWCADSILHLAGEGILTGDGDGRMDPNAPVTRQEAFVALARVLGLEESEKAPGFADDSAAASWAEGYIASMKEAGYVAGDKNGNLRPGDPVTRAEVITVLDRMAGFVNTDGTYSEDCKSNLIVNAGNVTLQDMTIEGDLIIADGVAEGDVYLDKVTVRGDIILRGCGENSFHILPGCQVRNVIVTKTTGGRLRLVNESGETIPMIYIEDGVGGVTLDGWELGDVVVNCDVQVTVKAQTVRTLSVVGNAKVTVEKNSTVARVEVGETAKGAALTVNGKVTTLVNDAGVEVKNKGTVGSPGGPSGGGGSSGGGSGSGSGSTPTVISEVRLQLLAPRFGETPDAADVLGAGYTAKTEWFNADGSPASYRWKADSSAADTFTANQAYKAVITLSPIGGNSFGESLKVKVTDGRDTPTSYTPAQVTVDGRDRVVTMEYDKTEDRDPVTGVSVVAPAAVNLGETGELTVSYWNNLLVDPDSFVYQWYQCRDAGGGGKTPIPGATGKEYTIPAADTQKEGNLYYCCDMTILGRVYPSGVKAVEVHDALDTDMIPVPTLQEELTVEDGGRWTVVEIGNLMCHKDVSYSVTVTAEIRKKDGPLLSNSVGIASFDYTDIPEDGTVSWRIDWTDYVSECIFAMLKTKLSYDIELGEVRVEVRPQLKDTPLSDKVQEKSFDMTGKGVFYVFTPTDKIPDELWQGPPRELQLIVRSTGGTFVDKKDPDRDPAPAGRYERVRATFRKSGEWVDETTEGHDEPYWNGTLYVPDRWLDGLGTGEFMSQVICTFYSSGELPDGGMNVYCLELIGGDIIFQLENS